MGLHLTQHAIQRLSQRSIAASDVELIMEIGSAVPDGYLVRAKDCQALEATLKGLLKRVRRLEGKRVVVADGCLVTAYHADRSEERRLLRQASKRDLQRARH